MHVLIFEKEQEKWKRLLKINMVLYSMGVDLFDKFRLLLKALDLSDMMKSIPATDRDDSWDKKNDKECMVTIPNVADSPFSIY